MKPKMCRYKDDECFGKMHKESEQCAKCWVFNACAVLFRNSNK